MGTYSTLLQSKPVSPSTPSAQPQEVANERKTERTEIRSEDRTSQSLPIRRRSRRYSFEFYDDQIFRLQQLKREAEDRGEKVTLSDMARAALDQYLQNRKK